MQLNNILQNYIRRNNMEENNPDFVLELPHKFRLIREGTGASMTYTLYSKEKGAHPKSKDKEIWKFVGYFGTINAGLKGYLRHCPNKVLKGTLKIYDVMEFYEKLEKEIEVYKEK